MKYRTRRLRSLFFTIMIVIAVHMVAVNAAMADATLKDVQTIVRTVGFLENSSDVGSVMAIIHNPNDSESLKSARQLENLINNEKKNIEPRLVPLNDLSELQNADFAFVTSGLESHFTSIKGALAKNKVLSFTLDRSCVNQSCCAVYINSKGRVEIIVNKAMVDATSARFKPVFLMMVTVI